MESWHIARVYVEAYGCSANLADSEIVQGLLGKAGHTIVWEPGSADASVVLSCTVKTPTQKKIEKRSYQKKLILTQAGVHLFPTHCQIQVIMKLFYLAQTTAGIR